MDKAKEMESRILEELSQLDKMYLKFGEKLESEFLSQSEFDSFVSITRKEVYNRV